MRNKIFMIAILLLLVIMFAGCAPFLNTAPREAPPTLVETPEPIEEALLPETTEAPPQTEVPWSNVYSDELLGFEITLPEGWSVQDGAFYEDSGSVEVTSNNFAPDGALVNITYILGESADGFAATAEDFVADQAEQSGAVGDLFYSAEDAIGQYPCYALSYTLTYPDGDVLTTMLYALDDGDGNCYFLYYGMGGDMSISEEYVAETEQIIHSFHMTGATLSPSMFEGQATEPPEDFEEQVFEPDDFLFLAGSYTPEQFMADYGTTQDIEEDDYTVILNYDNISAAFFKDPNSNYMEAYMNGVTLLDESAPVGVGGVQVGMSTQDAQAIIESNGYTQNMDIWEGRASLFYEYYDEYEELCFVTIDTQDGLVTQLTAMWGPDAFDARDSMIG